MTTDPAVAFKGAKYLISSGGAPRREGMTREDLLRGNCKVAEQFGKNIKTYCPDVKHVVVIFNPADLTGLVALLHSGISPEKLTTLAALDSSRLQTELAAEFGLPQWEITGAYTFGGHGEQMVVFGSGVRVNGKTLSEMGLTSERFDAINQQLLSSVDAQILEVDDAVNTLACSVLDSISELSFDDADYILDIVNQYLSQIEGDADNQRKVVRRYASLIVEDIRKQIYEHMERKTEDSHIVQKDLILFRKFVKNIKKDGVLRYDAPFSDKANIKKYLFDGYKKAYYPQNAFDSNSERLFSIILESDPDVIRWIKPPLNQLGLFWQAGQQYNPDFLVETTTGKFMVEVKASNELDSAEVIAKAREGIKWCRFASDADPDKKKWEYRLIADDNIIEGNTCRYTLGTAHQIPEE